jgi:hypothetical protein
MHFQCDAFFWRIVASENRKHRRPLSIAALLEIVQAEYADDVSVVLSGLEAMAEKPSGEGYVGVHVGSQEPPQHENCRCDTAEG